MIHMFFYISPIYMASFKSLFLLLVVLVCAAFAVVVRLLRVAAL